MKLKKPPQIDVVNDISGHRMRNEENYRFANVINVSAKSKSLS